MNTALCAREWEPLEMGRCAEVLPVTVLRASLPAGTPNGERRCAARCSGGGRHGRAPSVTTNSRGRQVGAKTHDAPSTRVCTAD